MKPANSFLVKMVSEWSQQTGIARRAIARREIAIAILEGNRENGTNGELKDRRGVQRVSWTKGLWYQFSDTNGSWWIWKRCLHRNPSRIRHDVITYRSVTGRAVWYIMFIPMGNGRDSISIRIVWFHPQSILGLGNIYFSEEFLNPTTRRSIMKRIALVADRVAVVHYTLRKRRYVSELTTDVAAFQDGACLRSGWRLVDWHFGKKEWWWNTICIVQFIDLEYLIWNDMCKEHKIRFDRDNAVIHHQETSQRDS